MTQRWKKWGVVAAMASAPTLLAASVNAAHETHSYGVAQFGGSGECGSSGSTHTVHEDTSDAFDDVFDDMQSDGIWDSSYMRDNKLCRGSYWEDASKQASGDDLRSNYGVDEADVVFIHTHGGHTTGSAYRSFLSMGNSSYDCSVRTDDDMLWDADLDIAVVKACQSGDYDVWLNGGYRQEYVDRDGQMRMWNAFHGDSSCGNHVKRYVEDYAEDSIYNGVGENWLDEAFDIDWGSNNDDCPSSIVFGSSSGNRDSMYEYGGWRDRKNTGTRSGSTFYSISGCDPSNGRTLP